ncbi:MAG: recombination regulator RecX [Candidatus Eremiobacteraeota bacterium]|nr:recombination regulator RecX [Candidatus Eremiobacteraeota bacterium]
MCALRALAQRRLSESQLWRCLERRGFSDEDIRCTVAVCKTEGYIDDRLFASLYVEQKHKAVGDVKLLAELVKRGIDREAAFEAIQRSHATQEERCDRALKRVLRTKDSFNYPAAARTLERLGFPSSLIYRTLREHSQKHGPFASLMSESADRSPTFR